MKKNKFNLLITTLPLLLTFPAVAQQAGSAQIKNIFGFFLFFFFLALGFYMISLTYSSMENIVLKVILNNLFVILFAWLFYKLEFSNLKNIKNQLQS